MRTSAQASLLFVYSIKISAKMPRMSGLVTVLALCKIVLNGSYEFALAVSCPFILESMSCGKLLDEERSENTFFLPCWDLKIKDWRKIVFDNLSWSWRRCLISMNWKIPMVLVFYWGVLAQTWDEILYFMPRWKAWFRNGWHIVWFRL